MSIVSIYIFILADSSVSVFYIIFFPMNFTLSEHSIYLDLCARMCVCGLSCIFQYERKNGNK